MLSVRHVRPQTQRIGHDPDRGSPDRDPIPRRRHPAARSTTSAGGVTWNDTGMRTYPGGSWSGGAGGCGAP